MAVTSNDIANQAVQLMGDNQSPVQGYAPTFDNSAAGKALKWLYTPCVQAVARQFSWDMARQTVALVQSGNPPPPQWAFEYVYPSNGIQVWQIMPKTIADPNNPLPIEWSVGNAVVAGAQSRVIWANQANALAVYNNLPSEAAWDASFRQSVVEFLARCLSLAIAGKPDLAHNLLEAYGTFEGIAETRDS